MNSNVTLCVCVLKPLSLTHTQKEKNKECKLSQRQACIGSQPLDPDLD